MTAARAPAGAARPRGRRPRAAGPSRREPLCPRSRRPCRASPPPRRGSPPSAPRSAGCPPPCAWSSRPAPAGRRRAARCRALTSGGARRAGWQPCRASRAGPRATASLSARWSAIDFGTSSPRTTLRYVRMRNERMNAISSGIQSSKSPRERRSDRAEEDAEDGDADLHRRDEADRLVEHREGRLGSTVPAFAISSRRGRRAVTSAYSAATKMAFPSTSRRMIGMRRKSLTPGRPRRGY